MRPSGLVGLGRLAQANAPDLEEIIIGIDAGKRQTAGYESERPQVVKIPQNGKIFCGILLCEILKIQFCALT